MLFPLFQARVKPTGAVLRSDPDEVPGSPFEFPYQGQGGWGDDKVELQCYRWDSHDFNPVRVLKNVASKTSTLPARYLENSELKAAWPRGWAVHVKSSSLMELESRLVPTLEALL
jgi:hypothetical protein